MPKLPETILFYYGRRLPEECTCLRNRELLAIALSRLEDDAVWARMVEEQPEEEGKVPVRAMGGDDPADVAQDCDEVVLRYKNFKALCESLKALAGEDTLAHAEVERHLENVRNLDQLLLEVRQVVNTAGRKEERNRVLALAVSHASGDFRDDVARPFLSGRGRLL